MSNSFLSSSSGTTLIVLTVLLVIAWLGLRLFRDRLLGAASRLAGATDALRVVRTVPVGSRERVVLLEHRGEQLLLGVTPAAVNLLARWPQGAVPPTSPMDLAPPASPADPAP